eukprot:CAMPEP_0202449538 /NCGR_PEP_ID=MMETSP1360-20130828/8253_1 /ASSEMBLY_ACC=CAM_ASM_000848 /TAXON_ID=515479 /ORGANISM="Licmophora paradoxa, Strain CCMP2313" /LENGTH=90 /DNA_ID=CAMNT_0049067485 /DNA_START=118 /DNA_END=390 /DNA_ORIENTATION=-
MLALRYSLHVPFWNADERVCAWEGVFCHADRVVAIELLFQNIQGTLPAEISILTDLRVLSVSGSSGDEVKSNVRGRLPESWGTALTNLSK